MPVYLVLLLLIVLLIGTYIPASPMAALDATTLESEVEGSSMACGQPEIEAGMEPRHRGDMARPPHVRHRAELRPALALDGR